MQHNLFTPITYSHTHENNVDSQRHYDESKESYSNQCKLVLSLLRQGVKLTSLLAMTEYRIGHLPRRIKDLKSAGHCIELSSDKVNGYRYYYIVEQ